MDDEAVLRELRRAERPVLRVEPEPPPVRKVALLSGSFDPVTVGHAALAEAALARADSVVLVYAARTLPKEAGAPPPLLHEATRLAVLRSFARNRPGHLVGICSHGLLAEQAAAARELLPGAELLLVMGSDKVVQLLDAKWYDDRDETLSALLTGARVLYSVREAEEKAVEATLGAPENARWAGRFERLDVPAETVSVSASRVRELLRRGGDPTPLVPPEALPAIRAAAARP